MKIAFLGDAHWGARGNSDFFLQRQLEFYRNIFFPYLVDNKIPHVVQFGDLLDQRKFVNVRIMHHLQKEYLLEFEKLGITQDIIVGNHDVVFNNTNRISALVEIVDRVVFPNTHVVYDPESREWDGCKFDFIPWINRENKKQVMEFIERSNADYLIGHLEINGFEMVSGIECRHGLTPDHFKRYKRAFSGHFHRQSQKGNIHYIGTPYEMNWGDYADPKGFHIFDTQTGETDFIKNPDAIYHKVMYNDDTVNYDTFDEAVYKDTIVKIIVEEKKNDLMFDRLVMRMSRVAFDVLISDTDSFDVSGTDIENMDVEDSLSILIKAVDGLETNLDKQNIKEKINSLHKEAEDLMLSE